MVEVKQIQTFNYENDYKNNIQLQFSDDQKFNAFIQMLCDYVNEFQETLKNYGNLFNLNNTNTYTFVLNTIGQILGLPPMGYFGDITPEQYKILISGQQAKNSYNGTNASLISLLNSLLPQYKWTIEDTGDMIIKVFLTPQTPDYTTTAKVVESDTITGIQAINNSYAILIGATQSGTSYFAYFGNNTWEPVIARINYETGQISWLYNTNPTLYTTEELGIELQGEPTHDDKISLKIQVQDIDPFISQIFQEGYLTPKPAGVGLEYDILTYTYFAWNGGSTTTQPQTSGWNEGSWL